MTLLRLSTAVLLIAAAALLPKNLAFLSPSHRSVAVHKETRSRSQASTFVETCTDNALMRKAIKSDGNGENDEKKQIPDNDSNPQDGDYKERLAKLDQTIANAEEERRKLLKDELERMDKDSSQEQGSSSRSQKETVDEPNLVPVEDWTPRELRQPPPPPMTDRGLERKRRKLGSTRSKVSRSDAGTLVIEITPEGISTGTLFNGAFSVAWFSAIVPATLAAVTGGAFGMALFMVPFWAAGGMVAKQAVVDPFISNTVTIGQFAWSVEQRYGGAKAAIQKQEGATADLQGARVECPMIVNNVPQYQLNLYDSGYNSGVISLGVGLPEEELQEVADEINGYLENLSSFEEGGTDAFQ